MKSFDDVCPRMPSLSYRPTEHWQQLVQYRPRPLKAIAPASSTAAHAHDHPRGAARILTRFITSGITKALRTS
jgi:hypothetical protein